VIEYARYTKNHIVQSGLAKAHGPMMTTTTKSVKKVQNFPILILIPVSQNQFYIYQPKHVFFFKFIMAGEKSCPSKTLQKIPVGSQAHRALNCLPKADELFIATELACESNNGPSKSQCTLTVRGLTLIWRCQLCKSAWLSAAYCVE
jgi:hypothetical protein